MIKKQNTAVSLDNHKTHMSNSRESTDGVCMRNVVMTDDPALPFKFLFDPMNKEPHSS